MNITLKSKISNEIESRQVYSLVIKSLLFLVVVYVYSQIITLLLYLFGYSINNEVYFRISWTSYSFLLLLFFVIDALESNSIKEQKTFLSIYEMVFDLPNISSKKIFRNLITNILIMINIFLLNKSFEGISIQFSPKKILLLNMLFDIIHNLRFNEKKLSCNNVRLILKVNKINKC